MALHSGLVDRSELHEPFPQGLDAAREPTPQAGWWYHATDTKKVYVCYEAGTWEEFAGGIITKNGDIYGAFDKDMIMVLGETPSGADPKITGGKGFLALFPNEAPAVAPSGGVAIFAESSPISGLITEIDFEGDEINEKVDDSDFTWAEGGSPTYVELTVGTETRTALRLNGSTDYLVDSTTTDKKDFRANDMSVVWKGYIRGSVPSAGNSVYLWSMVDSTTARIQFYIYNDSGTYKLICAWADASGESITYTFPSDPVVDTLYTFAFLKNNDSTYGDVILNINGVNVATKTLTQYLPDNTDIPFEIGRMNGTGYTTVYSQIDTLDFMLLNGKELTEAECLSFHESDEPFEASAVKAKVIDETGKREFSPHGGVSLYSKKRHLLAYSYSHESEALGYRVDIDLMDAWERLDTIGKATIAILESLKVEKKIIEPLAELYSRPLVRYKQIKKTSWEKLQEQSEKAAKESSLKYVQVRINEEREKLAVAMNAATLEGNEEKQEQVFNAIKKFNKDAKELILKVKSGEYKPRKKPSYLKTQEKLIATMKNNGVL